MSMDGMSMDGSSSGGLSTDGMDMTNETVAFSYLASILDDSVLQVWDNEFSQAFWYGIIATIGTAATFSIIQRTAETMRLRAAAANRPSPARPSNIFTRGQSRITALFRAVSYPQITPSHYSSLFKIPPLGIIIMLLMYFGFILALEFLNVQLEGDQNYEAMGLRATWLSMAQMPLLILLAGKKNLIGYVTNMSYERLNVLHRWVARGLLLTATMHFAFQSGGWNRLGLMQLEWATDTCPPTGIAAYAILLWLNLSTLAPIRNLWYEFFVFQHILTFFGFIIAIMLHIPSTALHARVYIYIPIGFYLLDRLLRTISYVYLNLTPCRATLTTFLGSPSVTKITIRCPRLTSWRPGAHVLLSLPRFGIFQSHPATIASIPASPNSALVFFLRAHNGFTKKIHAAALASKGEPQYLALLDGPYGAPFPHDFGAFAMTVLVAGGSGITYVLPQLLDLAHRAETLGQKLPLRAVEVVWCVRSRACVAWVEEELKGAVMSLKGRGIEVGVRVFVTRGGDDLAEEDGEKGSSSSGSEDGHENREAAGREKAVALAAGEENTPAASLDVGQSEGSAEVVQVLVGRPDVRQVLVEAEARAEGEMAVAVCGPVGLATGVRGVVAGMGARGKGVLLHVEGFGW